MASEGGAPKRVPINLRGVRYEVSQTVLSSVVVKEPHSLLAALDEAHPSYDRERKEFYFDRNPWVFGYIWDYFTTGQAHLPPLVCLGSVRQELEFWGLGDDILAQCCWDKLQAAEEEAITVRRFRKKWDHLRGHDDWGSTSRKESCNSSRSHSRHGSLAVDRAEEPYDRRTRSCREKLRVFLEKPHSSRAAKAWSAFIVVLILLSITLVMISTLDGVRTYDEGTFDSLKNVTEGRTLYKLKQSRPRTFYIVLEGMVLLILTPEFVLRWAVSCHRGRFWLNVINLADALGIFPTWIMFLLFLLQSTAGSSPSLRTAVHVVSGLRVFRVIRILSLAQTYPAMRILFLAMRASYRELVLLVAVVSVGALVFGHFIFVIEIQEDNIKSIPHGIWWAVVTMTTVGYGDVYPVTVAGKILGTVCAMTGILVVALPVPVIANNFSAFYDRMKVCQRLGRRHLPARRPRAAAQDSHVISSTVDANDNDHVTAPRMRDQDHEPLAQTVAQLEQRVLQENRVLKDNGDTST